MNPNNVRDLDALASRLLEVAEDDAQPMPQRRKAAGLVKRIGRRMQSLGDAASDTQTGVRELERQVRAYAWPANVIEWAEAQPDPEMTRNILRRARETSQTDTLGHLRLACDALADGEVVTAASSLERGRARWAAFMRQAGEVRARSADDSRSLATRWSDTVDDAQQRAAAMIPELPTAESLTSGARLALVLAALGLWAFLR